MRYYSQPQRLMISIHAPTRGATQQRYVKNRHSNISIHAPTRGATQDLGEIILRDAISIHAPTRGATYTIKQLFNRRRTFQSTLPRGERLYRSFDEQEVRISIHAPTRGATAILAKNSLSFSAKNHKTIFLQPNCSFSICSFSKKLRYLCIFQSANPSTISCPLPIRAFALLHNQSIVYCNSSVDTYVLYFCLILISQIIKSQTINTLINSVC